jgi:hypothetical protein
VIDGTRKKKKKGKGEEGEGRSMVAPLRGGRGRGRCAFFSDDENERDPEDPNLQADNSFSVLHAHDSSPVTATLRTQKEPDHYEV